MLMENLIIIRFLTAVFKAQFSDNFNAFSNLPKVNLGMTYTAQVAKWLIGAYYSHTCVILSHVTISIF